jgi:hypothetical protein
MSVENVSFQNNLIESRSCLGRCRSKKWVCKPISSSLGNVSVDVSRKSEFANLFHRVLVKARSMSVENVSFQNNLNESRSCLGRCRSKKWVCKPISSSLGQGSVDIGLKSEFAKLFNRVSVRSRSISVEKVSLQNYSIESRSCLGRYRSKTWVCKTI